MPVISQRDRLPRLISPAQETEECRTKTAGAVVVADTDIGDLVELGEVGQHNNELGVLCDVGVPSGQVGGDVIARRQTGDINPRPQRALLGRA